MADTRTTAASRKRIRIANGILMMCGVVSLAYAVGVATPDRPREFTLSWTLVLSLMAIIVGVACIDALNSLRLHASDTAANGWSHPKSTPTICGQLFGTSNGSTVMALSATANTRPDPMTGIPFVRASTSCAG